MTTSSIGFHAMPDSPHLTWSWCGYTLLALEGLSPDISASEVVGVRINGVLHNFRVVSTSTIMLIPGFKQEAQRVTIEIKPATGSTGHKPFTPPSYAVAPKQSWGFTSPEAAREVLK